jgi:hypothetical protein
MHLEQHLVGAQHDIAADYERQRIVGQVERLVGRSRYAADNRGTSNEV